MGESTPGWYPDPAGSGQQRYFDGKQWGPMAPPPAAGTGQIAAPPPPQKKSISGIRVLQIVGGLILLFVLISRCGGSGGDKSSSESTRSPSSSTTTAAPPTYSAAQIESGSIDICQSAIRKSLKDPDSAKFGDDWKAWPTPNSQPPADMRFNPAAGDAYWNAAGSVNAKNGFGGYTGDQGFYCEIVVTKSGNMQARAHSLEDALNPP